MDTIYVMPPHPATLEPEELLKQCDSSFGRTSGPGGQHRNKVETAAYLTHLPTGIESSARERRRQIENRHEAVARMRLKLAVQVRTKVHRERYTPSELWRSRRQGTQLSINPKHRDYPALLAEALDLIVARGFDVAGAAGVFGISMSQLAKLVRNNKHALAMVNAGRANRGLPPLK